MDSRHIVSMTQCWQGGESGPVGSHPKLNTSCLAVTVYVLNVHPGAFTSGSGHDKRSRWGMFLTSFLVPELGGPVLL